MAAVTVATVAKKVVAAMASNKKGRKTLGYILGIILFILSIPIIVICCLSDSLGSLGNLGNVDMEQFRGSLTQRIEEVLESSGIVDQLTGIEDALREKGFSDDDIHKAQLIYISCSNEVEITDSFYDDLAACFTGAKEDKSVYDILEETFGIMISDEERAKLNELY
ncbi:MAG: hypothetical protein J6128_04390, partial [Clostridia bacterium]|nr:hypothetical protein [Clostridia bacterium]